MDIDFGKVSWFYKDEDFGVGFNKETGEIVVWERKDFWERVVERAKNGDKEAIKLLEAYDEAGKKIDDRGCALTD